MSYVVHAVVRVPSAIPDPGTEIYEPAYTLRHVVTAPMFPPAAWQTLEWWQEYGVPFDRAYYVAVRTWITHAETGALVDAAASCNEVCVPGQPCYTLVLRYTLTFTMLGRSMTRLFETFTEENYPTLEDAACGASAIRRHGYRVLLPPEIHNGAFGNVMPETITPLPVL